MMTQQDTTNIPDLEQLIHTIKKEYVPDERIDLFAIKIVEKENEVSLTGKTTNHAAYLKLINEAKKLHPTIKDTIQILPNKNLGKRIWGVVTNSVGDLRAKPAFPSELVTQVLLGMTVKLLDKKNDWLQVQTPERYIGWITLGSLHLETKEELNNHLKESKIIVTSQYGLSHSKPNKSSEPVSDIVIGNLLVVINTLEDYYNVIYPDGREAFVLRQDATLVDEWLNNIELTSESIIVTSKQFMGIPYVWGGASSKGIDCSGFVKLVFLLHGIIIARDASQQIKYGVEVDEVGDFDALQEGDLVFFGEKATDEKPNERVVHVGFYIGNKEFIHASDNVHISSFDPESSIYDVFNTNRYLRSKRYLGLEGTTGITPILDHPFYLPHE